MLMYINSKPHVPWTMHGHILGRGAGGGGGSYSTPSEALTFQSGVCGYATRNGVYRAGQDALTNQC